MNSSFSIAYARPLGKERAAVKVRHIGYSKKYEVLSGIFMLSPEIMVVERPVLHVVDSDQYDVEASGKFLWTAETIDRYHLVVDMF